MKKQSISLFQNTGQHMKRIFGNAKFTEYVSLIERFLTWLLGSGGHESILQQMSQPKYV